MTRIEQAAAAVTAARAVLQDPVSLSRAPHGELVALLAQTAELSRIVDAQRVRLAGEIAERSKGPDEQSVCCRLGHRSAKEAVASAFGIRARDASALLAIAAATMPGVGLTGGDIAIKYPRVAAALGEGEISLAQARAIVEHLEPAAPRADLEQLAWAEGALVDAATAPDFPLVPELLVTQARAYVAVLDPDGVLPNAERQRAMRSLRMWQQPNGMWELRMVCPPEAGSAIKAFLDAYMSPRVTVAFRDDDPDTDPDADVDAEEAGREVDAHGQTSADGLGVVDDRSPEQKRHDVLLALVQAHAASGDAPVAGGEAPTLMFTGTIDAYAAYLHGAPHPDRALTIEHTGAIVPIETIDRLLCDAFVQKVVLDERGHPLELGRAERLFSRAQKRALAKRDKGCATPGCGMPVAWTETHHVRPWQLGGPTDITNGILLCQHCHHEVHAGRLRIIPASDKPGHWRIVPELRPADRYARSSRTGPSAVAATPPSAPAGSAGTLAADAVASLAIKLPDSHPALTVRPPRLRIGGLEARPQHMVRAPSRRAPNTPCSIEQRLHRILVHDRSRAARVPRFDLRPSPRIVLRT